MSNSKISALPAGSQLDGTEPLPVVQGGATVKALVSDLVYTASAGYIHAQKIIALNLGLGKVRDLAADLRIIWAGDSQTRGHGSASTAAGARQNNMIRHLRNMLLAAGIPATDDGFLGNGTASFPTTAYDDRITQGTGWNAVGGAGGAKGPGGFYFVATSATSSLSYQPELPCDTFVIWYATNSSPALGTFSYAIDAGTTTNQACNAANGLASVTVKTSLGRHRLDINWVSGANGVAILGVECFNSTIKQVRLINAGSSGSTTVDWTADAINGYGPVLGLTTLAADHVNIELSANDCIQALGAPAAGVNLQTLVTAAVNGGSTVSLGTFAPLHSTAVPVASQTPYIAQIRAVAITNNCLVNDIYARIATWFTAGYFDDYHPAGPLYNVIAGAHFSNMFEGTGRQLPPITSSFNFLINGDFEIDQANEAASVTLANGVAGYGIDGWLGQYGSGTMVVTLQQVTDAPPGLTKSLKMVATTGAALGASDYGYIMQRMEGLQVSKMNIGTVAAATISISFWVKATIAGTASFFLTNSSAARGYTGNFSIPTAGVWTLIKVDGIPLDMTGTWLTTNGIGLILAVCAGTGSTFQGTAQTWGGLVFGTSANTNFLVSNNNAFQVAGAKLSIEPIASPFVPEDRAVNIERCQRYYQKTFPEGTKPAQSGGLAGSLFAETQITTAGSLDVMWRMEPALRAAPTIVTYNPSAANANWRDVTGSSDVVVSVDPDTAKGTTSVPISSQTTALTANHRCYIHATADARL